MWRAEPRIEDGVNPSNSSAVYWRHIMRRINFFLNILLASSLLLSPLSYAQES